MLDDEINDISEKLDEHLTTLELRCLFCEKPYNLKKKKINIISQRKYKQNRRIKRRS